MDTTKHFDIGIQPHERQAYHRQLLADPAWDEHLLVLESELGHSIVAAIGSLTTRLMLDPTAKVNGLSLEFTSETDIAGPNVIFMPPSVVHTTGLDPAKIQDWQIRLGQSTEDKPMTFNLLTEPTSENDHLKRGVTVEFDGTAYSISRYGRLFGLTNGAGPAVEASAWDSWSVWDYHAEKKRQGAAERANLEQSVRQQITDLESAAATQQIATLLCTAGMLRDSSSIYMSRSQIMRDGRTYEDIGYREILAYQALGIRNDGTTKPHFELLHNASMDLSDANQRALVQHWFISHGQQMIEQLHGQPAETIHQQLATLLDAKIAETSGVASWPLSRLRQYLHTMLDQEVIAHSQSVSEYYSGHSFRHSRTSTGVHARSPYPEISGGEEYIDGADALALAVNQPAETLVEDLRQLQRIEEDTALADDRNSLNALTLARERLLKHIDQQYGAYFTRLDAYNDQAKLHIRGAYHIANMYDERAIIIEGILLAREIGRLADKF